MILVVDSGSTSTEWVFALKNKEITRHKGPGFNPYYYSGDDYLGNMKNHLQGKINFEEVSDIFFYGSGCSTVTNCDIVNASLKTAFANANIQLQHDLFGAAVALFGKEKGIACILGTGSNSCLWNGSEILENVPSLGYLLADEGSGTHIGSLILTDILLGESPLDVAELFYSYYKIDFGGVLDKLYKHPNPNKFLSSISLFAYENIENLWFRQKVKQNFINFMEKQICKYSDYQNQPISFIGSVAYSFESILRETFSEKGLAIEQIIKSPTDALLNFHLQKDD